ncbi:hypothetical protein [Candidatus Protochlamydia phocaeensis]|uniref:hypothetical protein n=1 Tax=Candidatus Protochlamydia phocaeensis TaxID=1414722 RepID=UPI00083859CC|nr:hypothetical protein [Candidatus Protochlamydia phocaeensis]
MKRSQQKAIPYLLSCKSYAQAAREIGVSENQIYPEFKAELDRQRNTVIELSIGTLKLSTIKASETLVELLSSPIDNVQRGAANDILNYVAKYKEIQE